MFVKSYDGLSLYVNTSENNKEPLVFIHGGPGAWSYSFEYFAYPYIKEFASGIYYDQRGCGRSEGDATSDYSLEAMMKDIENIRLSLGYDKISLIAHSFGGIIAVNYAHRYQQHVNKLILSNCNLGLFDSIREQINFGYKLLNEDVPVGEVMEVFQNMYIKLQEKGLYTSLQFKYDGNVQLMSEIDSKIENFTFNGLALHMKDYTEKSYYDVSKEVFVPTLVISGKGDYAVGPKHFEHFLFPHMEVVEMDTKHVPFIEDQDEYFNVIKTFLEK